MLTKRIIPVLVVLGRHLDRVAQHDVVLELDALGDFPVADIQTGYDSFGQHYLPPHLLKFSSNLRPMRPERSG